MRTCISIALLVPIVAAAQSRADEIRLARSAAPAAIAKDARVYVLEHGRYVVAEQGHSGEACMVIRSRATTLEPECGDAEADATVLAVERFRVEQRLAGRSRSEIDRAVTDEMTAGRFRAPARPALVFMMSSAQILADASGKSVGKWMPHVMVFYPGLRDHDLGLVESPDMNIPGVIDPETPRSALIVVARDWVDPAPTP
jgi:hypothetical protein